MSHNVTLNNNLLKQSRKTSSRNNHYYESNLDINQQIKTCNEFIKICLIKQAKNRLIINRFRLFKFRRKKSLKNRIKLFNSSYNSNNNYYEQINKEIPKITLEQILNRQWMQTFEHMKCQNIISLSKNKNHLILPFK